MNREIQQRLPEQGELEINSLAALYNQVLADLGIPAASINEESLNTLSSLARYSSPNNVKSMAM